MAKRKHKFIIHSFDELKAAYPLAVKETILRTHNYPYIAKLLDCKLIVPGIDVLDAETQLDLVTKSEIEGE